MHISGVECSFALTWSGCYISEHASLRAYSAMDMSSLRLFISPENLVFAMRTCSRDETNLLHYYNSTIKKYPQERVFLVHLYGNIFCFCPPHHRQLPGITSKITPNDIVDIVRCCFLYLLYKYINIDRTGICRFGSSIKIQQVF